LTKLFVEVGGLDLCRHVFFQIVDAIVPGNEEGLEELDNFKGYHQGDRDHVGKDQNPGKVTLDGIQDPVLIEDGYLCECVSKR
jgi:hypothetical protein